MAPLLPFDPPFEAVDFSKPHLIPLSSKKEFIRESLFSFHSFVHDSLLAKNFATLPVSFDSVGLLSPKEPSNLPFSGDLDSNSKTSLEEGLTVAASPSSFQSSDISFSTSTILSGSLSSSADISQGEIITRKLSSKQIRDPLDTFSSPHVPSAVANLLPAAPHIRLFPSISQSALEPTEVMGSIDEETPPRVETGTFPKEPFYRAAKSSFSPGTQLKLRITPLTELSMSRLVQALDLSFSSPFFSSHLNNSASSLSLETTNTRPSAPSRKAPAQPRLLSKKNAPSPDPLLTLEKDTASQLLPQKLATKHQPTPLETTSFLPVITADTLLTAPIEKVEVLTTPAVPRIRKGTVHSFALPQTYHPNLVKAPQLFLSALEAFPKRLEAPKRKAPAGPAIIAEEVETLPDVPVTVEKRTAPQLPQVKKGILYAFAPSETFQSQFVSPPQLSAALETPSEKGQPKRLNPPARPAPSRPPSPVLPTLQLAKTQPLLLQGTVKVQPLPETSVRQLAQTPQVFLAALELLPEEVLPKRLAAPSRRAPVRPSLIAPQTTTVEKGKPLPDVPLTVEMHTAPKAPLFKANSRILPRPEISYIQPVQVPQFSSAILEIPSDTTPSPRPAAPTRKAPPLPIGATVAINVPSILTNNLALTHTLPKTGQISLGKLTIPPILRSSTSFSMSIDSTAYAFFHRSLQLFPVLSGRDTPQATRSSRLFPTLSNSPISSSLSQIHLFPLMSRLGLTLETAPFFINTIKKTVFFSPLDSSTALISSLTSLVQKRYVRQATFSFDNAPLVQLIKFYTYLHWTLSAAQNKLDKAVRKNRQNYAKLNKEEEEVNSSLQDKAGELKKKIKKLTHAITANQDRRHQTVRSIKEVIFLLEKILQDQLTKIRQAKIAKTKKKETLTANEDDMRAQFTEKENRRAKEIQKIQETIKKIQQSLPEEDYDNEIFVNPIQIITSLKSSITQLDEEIQKMQKAVAAIEQGILAENADNTSKKEEISDQIKVFLKTCAMTAGGDQEEISKGISDSMERLTEGSDDDIDLFLNNLNDVPIISTEVLESGKELIKAFRALLQKQAGLTRSHNRKRAECEDLQAQIDAKKIELKKKSEHIIKYTQILELREELTNKKTEGTHNAREVEKQLESNAIERKEIDEEISDLDMAFKGLNVLSGQLLQDYLDCPEETKALDSIAKIVSVISSMSQLAEAEGSQPYQEKWREASDRLEPLLDQLTVDISRGQQLKKERAHIENDLDKMVIEYRDKLKKIAFQQEKIEKKQKALIDRKQKLRISSNERKHDQHLLQELNKVFLKGSYLHPEEYYELIWNLHCKFITPHGAFSHLKAHWQNFFGNTTIAPTDELLQKIQNKYRGLGTRRNGDDESTMDEKIS